ncbi:MAG: protein BatD [Bacteroidales bacterium]|nr:protein BatD [Bacteroidales bacterium]
MQLIITVILIFFSLNTQAQKKISFTASAPRVVEVGEYFRLSYTLNAKGKNFVGPRLDNFVFSGPMLSTNMSTQIINGKVSQSTSYVYNYTVQAQKEGKFNIPSAKVDYKGKTHTSNQLNIEVVKASQKTNSRTNSGANSRQIQGQTASQANIAKDDLFVRVNVDRKTVYKGEQIFATIKVYTRVNLSHFGDIKLPSFKGFWSQEIPSTEQVSLVRENYNNKIYNVGTIKKTILVPQRSGEITIEPFELECFINQQNRSQSIFDDFFGSSQTISKKLMSPAVKITVKPLPSGAPKTFTGAVGKFSMSARIDKTELKANEALTYKVKISGKGNFKLIDSPSVEFPADFEVYDPKLVNNFSTNENGITGSKTFEYLAIPRFGGDFTIPAFTFTFFDPSSGSYKNLASPSFSVKVAKSDEGDQPTMITRSSGTEVRMLGQDIRYIKTDKLKLQSGSNTWVQSTWFFMLYLIIILLSIFMVLLIHSVQKKRADLVGTKNKMASKISQKRLKKAKVALKEDNKEAFLNEVLTALWGYLGDKLNIDPAGYRRTLIEDYFKSNDVDTDLLNELFALLDECEYIRYSPTDDQGELDKILNTSADIINQMEKKLGKKAKK